MNPCQENLTVTNHGQTDEFKYWDILQDQLPGFFMEEKSLGDWSRLKDTKKKRHNWMQLMILKWIKNKQKGYNGHYWDNWGNLNMDSI